MVCRYGRSTLDPSLTLLVEENESGLIANVFNNVGMFVGHSDVLHIPVRLQYVDIVSLFYHEQPMMVLETAKVGYCKVLLNVHPADVRRDLLLRESFINVLIKVFQDGTKQEIYVFDHNSIE